MTLDEFVSTVDRSIVEFAAYRRVSQAEGEEAPDDRKTLAQWLEEVTAHFECVEIGEVIDGDRRREGTIERRRIPRSYRFRGQD